MNKTSPRPQPISVASIAQIPFWMIFGQSSQLKSERSVQFPHCRQRTSEKSTWINRTNRLLLPASIPTATWAPVFRNLLFGQAPRDPLPPFKDRPQAELAHLTRTSPPFARGTLVLWARPRAGTPRLLHDRVRPAAPPPVLPRRPQGSLHSADGASSGRRGGEDRPSPVRQRTLARVGEDGAVSAVSSHFRATATPPPRPGTRTTPSHARSSLLVDLVLPPESGEGRPRPRLASGSSPPPPTPSSSREVCPSTFTARACPEQRHRPRRLLSLLRGD